MESNPNEHMTTARTTEEDNPVRKANPHNKRITDRNKNGFKNRHLIHKGDRTNSNRAEIKPICSPESASTWLAPATEYVSTILSLSSSLSPIVSAESTANSSPRNPMSRYKATSLLRHSKACWRKVRVLSQPIAHQCPARTYAVPLTPFRRR